MRRLFLMAALAGLVVGAVVVGADAIRNGDSPGPSEQPASGSPAPARTDSPEGAAAAFLTAWSVGNFDAMYALVDPLTRTTLPRDRFVAAYTDFRDQSTQVAIEPVLGTVAQGRADVTVRLTTAYFGVLEYTTALNLNHASGAWRIAWAPSAIHPDLVPGRAFSSEVRRPRRGAILDREGKPLAITAYVLFAGLDRSRIADRAPVMAALTAFGFTAAQVDAAFASPLALNQRVTVGRVGEGRLEAARAAFAAFPGVLLFTETRRVHPLGAAAAHVVGYTRQLTAEELVKRASEGFTLGDRVGATGLEAALDARLAGVVGAKLVLTGPDGAVLKTYADRAFVQGQDIQTTLDADTLRAAQQRLGERAGAAVVIDPQTSAILALNSSPSFDPDAFENDDPVALARILATPGNPQANRATVGLYSAGSTFKLITGVAGMLHLGLTPSDRLECGSVWTGIDPPRRNWEGPQGPLTIAGALMRSCNPVFYEIGQRLYNAGDGLLSQTARAFGLGQPTGQGVLDEASGLVPDPAWKRRERNQAWFPGDEVNLAIGQGDLLVTPLQLANAYSSFVANALRTPAILAGQAVETRGAPGLSDAQWAHLFQGLRLVTSATGTASAAFANAGYTDFAGKSGTAEDAGQQQHVLFVAMAPAAAPRAVAAVVLDEGQSGSIEAGPIARDIVLAALR